MFDELKREGTKMRRGRVWWAVVAALAALLAAEGSVALATLTSAGLAASAVCVVVAEVWRRSARSDLVVIARSQTLSGAAIAALGVATGPVAAQLRAGVLTTSMPYVWIVWIACLGLLTFAGMQIFTSTKRLIVDGRRDTERLVTSEREALEAELLVQQQRLEPELVLRAMTVIADQAQTAPRDAESAVERLAAFLRKSLTTTPAISASLTDEVTRAKEFEDILRAGGVTTPVSWTIDDNVSVPRRVLVRHRNGHRLVPVADIDRFFAADNVVCAVVSTAGSAVEAIVDYSLDELERRLTGAFVRINRRDLLAIDRIERIVSTGDGAATVVTRDGVVWRVSRRRAASVREALAR